jgi:hypothetical protein
MKELSILKQYGWTDALIAEFEKSLAADALLRFGHPNGTGVIEVNAANLFVPVGPSSSAGTAVFLSQSTTGSLEAK